VYECGRVCVCVYTHTHKHTHTYKHKHTHTHTHTHTQVYASRDGSQLAVLNAETMICPKTHAKEPRKVALQQSKDTPPDTTRNQG